MFEAGKDIGSLLALKYLVIDEEGGQVLSDTAFAKFRAVLFSVFIFYTPLLCGYCKPKWAICAHFLCVYDLQYISNLSCMVKQPVALWPTVKMPSLCSNINCFGLTLHETQNYCTPKWVSCLGTPNKPTNFRVQQELMACVFSKPTLILCPLFLFVNY